MPKAQMLAEFEKIKVAQTLGKLSFLTLEMNSKNEGIFLVYRPKGS
jgi:hypothetical protein